MYALSSLLGTDRHVLKGILIFFCSDDAGSYLPIQSLRG